MRYLITAGSKGSPYDGHLFAIRAPRESGLHSMLRMGPDGDVHMFALSKPHFLNEHNVVIPSVHTNLMRFVFHISGLHLQVEGTSPIHIPVWVGDNKGGQHILYVEVGLYPFIPEIPSEEQLGAWIREGWVEWAKTLRIIKPDWVKPYSELTENMKQADNTMGVYLLQKLREAGLLKEGIACERS